MARILFWFWVSALLVLHVVPLGENNSSLLSGNKLVFRLDYLLHVSVVLGFAWIYIWSRIRGESIFRDNEIFLVIIISFIVAVCFEGIQAFLPYRKFNPMDLLANMIGTLISSFLIIISYGLSLTK